MTASLSKSLLHCSLLAVLATAGRAQLLGDAYVSDLNAPAQVAAGSTFVLTYDVCNAGPGNFYANQANAWRDRVYINSVQSTAGANVLATEPHWGTLHPGRCYSNIGINAPLTLTVPSGLTQGNYYIGYRVDYQNVIPETNNNNNISWTPVFVTTRPDFVCDPLVAQPTPILPGQSLSYATTMRNIGGSAGNSGVRAGIYISTTTTPQPADLVAQTPSHLIGPGAGVPVSGAVTVPSLPYGDYYLVVVADHLNNVIEQNEGNNAVWAPIQIGPVAAANSFGIACPGSNGPVALSASTVPTLGATVVRGITGMPPFTIFVFAEGLSNTSFNGVPLPVALPGTGTPGCLLSIRPDVAIAGLADAAGTWSTSLTVPMDPAFLGFRWFDQAFVIDPPANALGLTSSNALELVVGF